MPFQGFNFGGMTNRFQQARAQRTNAVQSAAPAQAVAPPSPQIGGAAQAVAQQGFARASAQQQAQFSDASNPAGGFIEQAQTQANTLRNSMAAQPKPNNCG